MTSGIRLIVGLGNPGPEYTDNRHNVGAWFVQAMADSHQAPFKLESKLFGSSVKVTCGGQIIRLFIPNTYMNESGKAVLAVAHYYKIHPESILIAHDELDFEPGVVRLKKGGGHGGHNGLRDICSRLGSAEFYRLRIGIGHPGNKNKVSKYVLSRPNKDDQISIERSIDEAFTIVQPLIDGEFEKAFHQLHSN